MHTAHSPSFFTVLVLEAVALVDVGADTGTVVALTLLRSWIPLLREEVGAVESTAHVGCIGVETRLLVSAAYDDAYNGIATGIAVMLAEREEGTGE